MNYKKIQKKENAFKFDLNFTDSKEDQKPLGESLHQINDLNDDKIKIFDISFNESKISDMQESVDNENNELENILNNLQKNEKYL